MKIQQAILHSTADVAALGPLTASAPSLVLVFGAPAFFEDSQFERDLVTGFPGSHLLGCSTAGEISRGGVHAGSCVITAIHFDHTTLVAASTDLAAMEDSTAAGRRLAEQLKCDDLRAVLVFGQGVRINGSALIEGMTDRLGTELPIMGGLAGDNGAFARTWTLGRTGISDRALVAVGLRGSRLQVSHGSFGGWEPFGPARKVTRCAGNVLFELDGEPALAVYKRYLGDYARDLPASGLLFPFAMLGEDRGTIGLIRTILGIDEANGSLILAGEIRPDGYLKLMHASTDSLVDGAEAAAAAVGRMRGQAGEGLAILVSCVGRKLVMGDRVDEEVEAVADVLGPQTVPTGFYSYGEISPFAPTGACKLHNQTMTVTCLAET